MTTATALRQRRRPRCLLPLLLLVLATAAGKTGECLLAACWSHILRGMGRAIQSGAGRSRDRRLAAAAPPGNRLARGGARTTRCSSGQPPRATRRRPTKQTNATADAAAYEYLVGANAHWMPTAAATGDTGSVDAALDGLQV